MIGGLVAAIAVAAAAGALMMQAPPVADVGADTSAATPAGNVTPGDAATPGGNATVPSRRDTQSRAEQLLATAPLALDRDAADRELDAINVILEPQDVTPATARRALRRLDDVTPHLPSGADSVRADLLRFQAYVHLDQLDRGCTLLRAAAPRVTREGQRQTVTYWLDQLCQ